MLHVREYLELALYTCLNYSLGVGSVPRVGIFRFLTDLHELFRTEFEVCNCESCQQNLRPVVPRVAAASDVTVPRRNAAPCGAMRECAVGRSHARKPSVCEKWRRG
jgi:hypothetical protein